MAWIGDSSLLTSPLNWTCALSQVSRTAGHRGRGKKCPACRWQASSEAESWRSRSLALAISPISSPQPVWELSLEISINLLGTTEREVSILWVSKDQGEWKRRELPPFMWDKEGIREGLWQNHCLGLLRYIPAGVTVSQYLKDKNLAVGWPWGLRECLEPGTACLN